MQIAVIYWSSTRSSVPGSFNFCFFLPALLYMVSATPLQHSLCAPVPSLSLWACLLWSRRLWLKSNEEFEVVHWCAEQAVSCKSHSTEDFREPIRRMVQRRHGVLQSLCRWVVCAMHREAVQTGARSLELTRNARWGYCLSARHGTTFC